MPRGNLSAFLVVALGALLALDGGAQETDLDGDGLPDASDSCPLHPSSDQTDVDGNGRGDLCECGDQTQDGTVSVLDILAINAVIFGQVQESPLCDANDDQECNVKDIPVR